MVNHVLIAMKLITEPVIFLLQIRCTELGFTQELFQFAFQLFLHDIFLHCDDKILKILFLNYYLR